MLLRLTVSPADAGRRAGRLAAHFFSLSGRDLARIKRENTLLLDGAPVRGDTRVKAGQTLTVLMPDAPPSFDLPAPALLIPYQDSSLIVIDKQACLPTMRSPKQGGPSVEDLYEKAYGPFRPVSRLDKGTGGLLVAARTGYVQHLLADRLHSDRMIREYLAVADGVFDRETGVIDLPIGHEEGSASLRRVRPDGKPSVTCYRVLKASGGRTLLRLRLLTGRTHQIRVHLSAIGHPVTGDHLYGQSHPLLPGCFALHSAYLFLSHPLTGKDIFVRSGPPDVFRRLLYPDDAQEAGPWIS